MLQDLPPPSPAQSKKPNARTPLLPDALESSTLDALPEGPTLLTSITIVSLYLMTWVGQSEYAQSITTGDGGDAYNKPGFICYLNHTILVFMFPLIWLALRLHPSNKKTFMEHLEVWRGMYSWRQVSWVYSVVAVEYAICIWSWVLGLTMISVSSSNALYQLQCIFTVWFACIFLGEEMNRRKWIGCAVAFFGIVGVVLPPYFMDTSESESDDSSSDDSDDHTFFGTMLTVISAVTWAIYEVAYTYVSDVKNEKMPLTSSKFDSIMETMTTLGMIGLANAIAVLPFLLILHMSGQENFELPSNSQQATSVFTNACLSFIFDLSFALAIYLTNPVIVSISSALVIPLSFIADCLLHDLPINFYSIGATPLVLVGLYILNKEEDEEFDAEYIANAYREIIEETKIEASI